MDLTTAMTGLWPAFLIVSTLMAALLSFLLIWLYRQAVGRQMLDEAGEPEGDAGETPGEASGQPRFLPALRFKYEAEVEAEDGGCEAAAAMGRTRLRVLGVYVVAGLAYALVVSLPWILFAGDGFVLLRWLWVVTCYAWPVVLTARRLAGGWDRMALSVVAVYGIILTGLMALSLSRNPGLTLEQLVFFWSFANLPATILLTMFLNRSVRAVGPLVLVFVAVSVFGAFLFVQWAARDQHLLASLVDLGGLLGLKATQLFILMHLFGITVLAFPAWWLVGRLARAYRNKRFSDQELTIHSLWLFFALVQPIPYAFEGWAWFLTGLAGFAAYLGVTRLGFFWMQTSQKKDRCLLLLLRVFSLGKRSERIFDQLGGWWPYLGSMAMIAGPDLITTTVEPHEFLDFVSGRLPRQFVRDRDDLERRVQAIDRAPDPDGRGRINEFFCHADTWQMTMERLARESDAVLMDLRGFSQGNQGCLFELQQLLNGVSLARVTLLVDNTTDQTLLRQVLEEFWRQLPQDSPNGGLSSPLVHIMEARSGFLRPLLCRLAASSGSQDLCH